MSIEIIEGDLLDAFDNGEVNVIGHCCNAQGKMNSGIAKSIRERYPVVYNRYFSCWASLPSILGWCIGVHIGWESDNKKVYNLVGQEFYGYDGKKYLIEEELEKALIIMASRTTSEDIIGFPYNMGCDRAGGNWEIVYGMISRIFEKHQVKIYRLKK